MLCISNSMIHKCSLQESCQSSFMSPLWSVRSTQSKCPHHTTAADHLDLVLSPEYKKELEHRSLQVGDEMKTEAVSSLKEEEKTTGDGWLGMSCPWLSRMILPYTSTLPCFPPDALQGGY